MQDSALFGFYGTNCNAQRKPFLIMDNVIIENCGDVIAIVESTDVNNHNGEQLQDVFLNNFNIAENRCAVLYHTYPRMALTYITIEIITNNWYYNETDFSLNHNNGRVFIVSTVFHSHFI